jgi:DNA polymerase-3 subunit epsilon
MTEREELYSENRLKIELRMKPKTGAAPAAWFKSSYSSRQSYAVYRLYDCEPLPAKKPISSKQQEAIKRMSIVKKLKQFDRENANGVKASESIQKLFEEGFIVLDTETTGLGSLDQVIELGVISMDGQSLYDKRYKPTVEINEGAYGCHGISIDDLQNSPFFSVDADHVKELLLSNNIVIFNAKYDLGVFRATFKAFGIDWSFLDDVKAFCAMYAAADIYGATNRHGTISLASASFEAGFENPMAHSAIGDCLTTLAVMKHMAGFVDRIQAERSDLERSLLEKAGLLNQ